MGQDRRKYQNDRILIESSRILTPQFAGTTITIDGSQVELLRNIVSYLHQERTFVSEYHGTYYLTASDSDFDELSAIVADLEEKLMGDPNTLFGVYERWSEDLGETKSGDGTYSKTTTVVPAGYIYVAQLATVANFTTAPGVSYILVADGVTSFYVKGAPSLTVYQPLWHTNELVLEAGDWIQLLLGGCLDGDDIRAGVWGYKMKVQS